VAAWAAAKIEGSAVLYARQADDFLHLFVGGGKDGRWELERVELLP